MGDNPSRNERDDLATLDGMAQALIERAAPIRFGIAQTPAEQEAVYRLRYQVVIAQGWGTPAEFPDEIERDADDERAVHLAGWDGAALAATARLIFPAPDRRLPTEEVFGVEAGPRGRVVNVDRLAIDAAHSDHRHRLMLRVLAHIWLTARAGGCDTWVGIDSPGMIRLYRVLGFEGTVLAPPRRFWGEDRVPFRFDGAAAAPAVIARWAAAIAAERRAETRI
jgi:N-acyl-L-homoserine lactone synthetase